MIRQHSPGIWAKQHEAGDEFRIDPVRLGACSPRHGKRLDLSWRKLLRDNPCFDQRSPQAPFLSAGGFETDLDGGRQLTDHRDQLLMPCWCVGQTKPLQARQTEPVEPVTTHVYPYHTGCCYHVTLSSLCFAVPQNGPPSIVRDGEERQDQPASNRGQATRCSALYPTPLLVLAGTGNGVNVAGLRHIRCSVPASGGSDCSASSSALRRGQARGATGVPPI